MVHSSLEAQKDTSFLSRTWLNLGFTAASSDPDARLDMSIYYPSVSLDYQHRLGETPFGIGTRLSFFSRGGRDNLNSFTYRVPAFDIAAGPFWQIEDLGLLQLSPCLSFASGSRITKTGTSVLASNSGIERDVRPTFWGLRPSFKISFGSNAAMTAFYELPIGPYDKKGRHRFSTFGLDLNVRLSGLVSALEKKEEQKEQSSLQEKAFLDALKSGVLIVRLDERSRVANYYRSMGKGELADETLQKAVSRNKEIISAFRELFTFCRIEFMFVQGSKAVREGQSKGFLLDNNGAISSEVDISGLPIYVLDLGDIYEVSSDKALEPMKLYDSAIQPLNRYLRIPKKEYLTRDRDVRKEVSLIESYFKSRWATLKAE